MGTGLIYRVFFNQLRLAKNGEALHVV